MAYKNRAKANLGMQLERIIDMANNKYRNAGVADIRKVPTPVKITSSHGRNVTGRKEKAEWTDYTGVYQGRSIIFDAKETSNKTSFPLANIEPHQYATLKSFANNGAVAFLLIYFKVHDKYYLLLFELLYWAWERAENGGRKSIEYDVFEKNCCEVKSKDGYTLHYLEAI